MNLFHHPHEAQNSLALQAFDMLHNLRHADSALNRIEQRQAAQHCHIGVLFLLTERKPGHFIIG
ncbi:hypothetical protein D3C87_1845630 [compost metagenome]